MGSHATRPRGHEGGRGSQSSSRHLAACRQSRRGGRVCEGQRAEPRADGALSAGKRADQRVSQPAPSIERGRARSQQGYRHSARPSTRRLSRSALVSAGRFPGTCPRRLCTHHVAGVSRSEWSPESHRPGATYRQASHRVPPRSRAQPRCAAQAQPCDGIATGGPPYDKTQSTTAALRNLHIITPWSGDPLTSSAAP
jgi:hypothetical protein